MQTCFAGPRLKIPVYCSWSRSFASDFANSRDTCICEMPTRSAIWVWVIDSKNRNTSTVRSRSGRASSRAATPLGPRCGPSGHRHRRGYRRSTERRPRRSCHLRRSTGCYRSCPPPILRPPRRDSTPVPPPAPTHWGPPQPLRQFRGGHSQAEVQLLERRGTLTDQLLSRKWRRTSPMMVGTANETKSEPVSTSNRVTAFTRPTRAT